MSVIKLVEDYQIASLRNDVRDSLMMAGEQAIALQLYHPRDTDASRCPLCGDDIYKSPETNCPECLGTTFSPAVRSAKKIWALFTDTDFSEGLTPKGTWIPDARSVQLEAFPLLNEHDVIVRVQAWAADGTPETLRGFYILQRIIRRSLRTGARAGQYSHDVVAQKAQITELAAGSPLTRYEIVGQHFDEVVRSTGSPTSVVVAPDTKVVYFPFPFEPAPGGVLAPVGGIRTYAETIGNDVDTSFTITHNLGTKDVEVGAFDAVTGEEVTVDVASRTTNTVVVRFAIAPGIDAYRIVCQG